MLLGTLGTSAGFGRPGRVCCRGDGDSGRRGPVHRGSAAGAVGRPCRGGPADPSVSGGRPWRRLGCAGGPWLGTAAEFGDPPGAVLFVSDARGPPHRPVPVDSSGGGLPLRGAPRLLTAGQHGRCPG